MRSYFINFFHNIPHPIGFNNILIKYVYLLNKQLLLYFFFTNLKTERNKKQKIIKIYTKLINN